jgi:AcrR family transcriptional regulator
MLKHEFAHICGMKRKRPASSVSRPARGGKRFENKEKTRRAILAAALELFARDGFHETTTRAISRKAKIAEGTLFNYFETKEDLALYFFDQELDEVIGWYEGQKRMARAALPEKLFAIIHHLLERLGPYEDFIGAVYLRALQPTSKLSPLSLPSQEHNVRYLRFISGILADAARDEEIPAVGDLGAYGFALFHMAMMTYWLEDRSPGKEQTLALLDRCLKTATGLLKRGGWEW